MLSPPGSSPHTRGAQPGSFGGVQVGGIIPAYAGSTAASRRSPVCAMDHPRIRGEHLSPRRVSAAGSGSSPHTRGAHVHVRLRYDVPRIIPAYAGSTRTCRPRRGKRSDHPRIRGEHFGLPPFRPVRGGSSPHTRGARALMWIAYSPCGIIPAYAGSTPPIWFAIRRARDHPRIRGEHVIPSRNVNGVTGSSPHTRGALGGAAGEADPVGIIPAYAGSTFSSVDLSGRFQDHPRIRGEHGPACRQVLGDDGSSPHTRGARLPRRARRRRHRIIPAYAGSTKCPFVPRGA